MSALVVWCVANAVAGAHVRGAGYTLGAGGAVRQRQPAGRASAGGAHDFGAAQQGWRQGGEYS